MRSSLFCLMALALIAVLLLPFTAQAADASSDLKSLQVKLRETNPKLADELERRLKQSEQEVMQFRRGQVIFGRIQVEGEHDPRAVLSQMIILEGGYFVDAIGDIGKPIGFRLNGYETVVISPKGPGPIEDVGTILLRPLSPDRLCSVTGRLQVETHLASPKLEELTVAFDTNADPINTPHNGTEGLSGHYRPVTATVAADGTFTAKGMSPGKYTLYVKAPNCVLYLQQVDLKEGKIEKLEPIQLELLRKMNVEYAVSKDGDFDDVDFKKTTLKADDRWRASEDSPSYAFDVLIGQKVGKLLFEHRYLPSHIQDLGLAELSDELKVNMKQLKSKQAQTAIVEEGHIYVIFQAQWNYWILVRTTEVGAIAVEKQN